MYQAGLILEGGGFKGAYTTGVLDFFLEKGIEFDSCYGVSAGAIYMCSYLAGQKGRGLRTSLDYLDDKRYCGMYSLLTTGDFFGAEFCYKEIPTKLDPLDNEAFLRQRSKAYAVVTNVETGKAEYLRVRDLTRDTDIIRASGSLPLLSRNVPIGDNLYLDGGIADSIPIRRSIRDGLVGNVVVLTKEEGYVRSQASLLGLMKARYRKYPKVYEGMRKRHIIYNKTMRFVEKEKDEGRAFVIRPRHALDIGRVERNAEKIKAIYEIGYRDAKECYPQLLAFLEQWGNVEKQ